MMMIKKEPSAASDIKTNTATGTAGVVISHQEYVEAKANLVKFAQLFPSNKERAGSKG